MNDKDAIVRADDPEVIKRFESHPLVILLAHPEIIGLFEKACGQEAGSVMINIINACSANPELWQCEPMSVINAALDAASLQLSLSPSLGQACILPFKKYKKGTWEVESIKAQFVPMKRGIKEMADRTHDYRFINSFTVFEGQEWEENQMTGLGTIKGRMVKGGKAIGYGAYFQMWPDPHTRGDLGRECTVYMTHEEMMAHVERYSQSWDRQKKCIRKGSKWDTDFDMMAEGVVLKKLIRSKGRIKKRDEVQWNRIEEGKPYALPADLHPALPPTLEENMKALGYSVDPKPAETLESVMPLDAAIVQDETRPEETGPNIVSVVSDTPSTNTLTGVEEEPVSSQGEQEPPEPEKEMAYEYNNPVLLRKVASGKGWTMGQVLLTLNDLKADGKLPKDLHLTMTQAFDLLKNYMHPPKK